MCWRRWLVVQDTAERHAAAVTTSDVSRKCRAKSRKTGGRVGSFDCVKSQSERLKFFRAVAELEFAGARDVEAACRRARSVVVATVKRTGRQGWW